jgi:hypothetical protein
MAIDQQSVSDPTTVDHEFARRLLSWVWRQHGVGPRLDRWVLATLLEQIGVQLRERAGGDETLLRLARECVDTGGWCSSPLEEAGWSMEIPPADPVPWWRRLWKGA